MAYLIVAIVIFSSGICHYIAKKKGLSASFWIALGALIGPLAVLIILFVPAKAPPGSEHRGDES
jgi:hypothetical protein